MVTEIGKPRRTIEIEPTEVPDTPESIPANDPPIESPPEREPNKVPADV